MPAEGADVSEERRADKAVAEQADSLLAQLTQLDRPALVLRAEPANQLVGGQQPTLHDLRLRLELLLVDHRRLVAGVEPRQLVLEFAQLGVDAVQLALGQHEVLLELRDAVPLRLDLAKHLPTHALTASPCLSRAQRLPLISIRLTAGGGDT